MNERASESWLVEQERGSLLGMRLVSAALDLFGRRGVHLILYGVALYFTLVAGTARRASRRFLTRVRGHASLGDVFRHFHRFAQVTADRLLFARGRLGAVEVQRAGSEHLIGALEQGGGALLIGAHMGSFEVMRTLAGSVDVTINVLAHWKNARKITAFLAAAGAGVRTRVIEIDPGNPAYILKAKERVDAGEIVALLGDRAGINERSVRVEFLGAPARFSTGPFELAALLKCPVFLVFGLFEPPRLYRVSCERFSDRVELPREGREAKLVCLVESYATRLAARCVESPENWFNFFDFWEEGA